MLPLVLNPHESSKSVWPGEARRWRRRAALLAEAGVEARLLLPNRPGRRCWRRCRCCSWPACRKAKPAIWRPAPAPWACWSMSRTCCRCATFHVPAIVRRGDLLLTASTGGQVPGLARALREWLAEAFGPEWTGRLKDLSLARARWRSEGLVHDAGFAECARPDRGEGLAVNNVTVIDTRRGLKPRAFDKQRQLARIGCGGPFGASGRVAGKSRPKTAMPTAFWSWR